MLGLGCCSRAFSTCREHGPLSSCGVRVSRRSGLSCCGTQAVGLVGSVVVVHGPSCFYIWSLPGPGTEPVSSASAGRFLTTGPPGKPPFKVLFKVTCPQGETSEEADLGESSPRASGSFLAPLVLCRIEGKVG